MKTKICTKCGMEKPLSEFFRDKESKSGAHRQSNLAIACERCNLSKAAKMPEDIGLLI